MPELPEAESIARALKRALVGRAITKVEVFFPRLRTPITPLLTAGLVGRRFVDVRRRARYAVADLDDGRALVMHFGMSGVVRVEPRTVPRRKHEHVWIHLDDGRAFKFEDPRRFGSLEVRRMGPDGWPDSLAGFGVEPLSDAFDGAFLFRASRGKTCPVKELLMDNAIVTGIGNIYTAETLFAARVRPSRRAERLTRAECGALAANAKRILTAAIALGGTTVSDFLNVDGSEGRFATKLMVYGKEGKPCPRCGARIRNVTIGGRSSCYCPKCQK